MRGACRSARRTTGATRGAFAVDSRGTRRRSPTPIARRGCPTADRVWIAVGAQYRFNRNLALDGGFVYIPVKSPDILQNAGSTAVNGLIKGNYDASVTIFSAQLTYTF